MMTINAEKLKQMFLSGKELVSKNFEYINDLNVFPVPDGDTGTNLKITLEGACLAISDQKFDDLRALGKQFSRGMLMNARGNSGVIFSQIIKGFSSVLGEGQKEMSISQIIDAFEKAKEVAYSAVNRPVEGTILTVIRVVSERIKAPDLTFKTVNQLFEKIVNEAEAILNETPNFLPELKEAGLVDSGGYGLWKFLEGMLIALKNEHIDSVKHQRKTISKKRIVDNQDDPNEGFGYCCEFIMQLGSKVHLSQENKRHFNIDELKNQLNKIGDSLVVVHDDDIVKVHVHSLQPYEVLRIGALYGEFKRIKFDNMTMQFLERNPGTTLEQLSNKTKPNLSDEIKIIATVPSQVMHDIYHNDFKIDQIINTESKGNPSIQEFLDKIRETHSRNIIIVTDNANIILAVNQAIELIPKDERTITLIPAKDIGRSYLACLAYNPIESYNTNVKEMNWVLTHSVVGKVSRSVKNIKYSHVEVKKDEFIGIIDKKIVANSKNINTVTFELIDNLVKELRKAKNAYIIVGRESITSNVLDLEKYLNESKNLKTTIIKGDQPIYSYYIVLN